MMNVEIKRETTKRIIVNTIKFTEFWTFYRMISILNDSKGALDPVWLCPGASWKFTSRTEFNSEQFSRSIKDYFQNKKCQIIPLTLNWLNFHQGNVLHKWFLTTEIANKTLLI